MIPEKLHCFTGKKYIIFELSEIKYNYARYKYYSTRHKEYKSVDLPVDEISNFGKYYFIKTSNKNQYFILSEKILDIELCNNIVLMESIK